MGHILCLHPNTGEVLGHSYVWAVINTAGMNVQFRVHVRLQLLWVWTKECGRWIIRQKHNEFVRNYHAVFQCGCAVLHVTSDE